MPFTRLPNVKGLVYTPPRRGRKKFPCPGCFQCQWCSDDRCATCFRAYRKAPAAAQDLPRQTGSEAPEGSDETR